MDSKRTLDLALGSVGLVIAAPILAGIWLAMRLSGDRGPFLYRATRVGEGGATITILKVRTMANGGNGPGITAYRDARITHVGRVLRRFRLDELPQLVNVVQGQMSLVGPRPEDPRYVDWTNPLHQRVFVAKPGITGLAQLEFHDEARQLATGDPEEIYRQEILPLKLRLDAAYLDRRSLLLDLKILARTAKAILS